MILVAIPVAAVVFAVYAVSRALKAPKSNDTEDAVDTEEEKGGIVVGTDEIELVEAGVPVVSDILGWIEDSSARLGVTEKPVVMRVQKSTFVSFVSNGLEMNLWLSGPSYMGPFPRLCSLSLPKDHPGITIERTQLSLERAVIELQKKKK